MATENIMMAWKGVRSPAVVAVAEAYPTVPASSVVSHVVTDIPSGTVAPGCLS